MDKSQALVNSMRALQDKLTQMEHELADERKKTKNLEEELIKLKFRKDKKINQLQRDKQSLDEEVGRRQKEAEHNRQKEKEEAEEEADKRRRRDHQAQIEKENLKDQLQRIERDRRECLKEMEAQRVLIKRQSQQIQDYQNKEHSFHGLVQQQISDEANQIEQIHRLDRLQNNLKREQGQYWVEKLKYQKKMCALYDNQVTFLQTYVRDSQHFIQKVNCTLRSHASSFILNSLRPEMIRITQTDEYAQQHLQELQEKQAKGYRLRRKYMNKIKGESQPNGKDKGITKKGSVGSHSMNKNRSTSKDIPMGGSRGMITRPSRSNSRGRAHLQDDFLNELGPSRLDETLVGIEQRIRQLTRLKQRIAQ